MRYNEDQFEKNKKKKKMVWTLFDFFNDRCNLIRANFSIMEPNDVILSFSTYPLVCGTITYSTCQGCIGCRNEIQLRVWTNF